MPTSWAVAEEEMAGAAPPPSSSSSSSHSHSASASSPLSSSSSSSSAAAPAAEYPATLLALRRAPRGASPWSGAFSLEDFDVVPKPLGAGKFGKVFRARERRSRRVVCLKQVEKRALLEEGVVRQFQREVETHARLHHAHVLRMFAYFHDEAHCYLVLEFANGGTLYERLAALPQRRTTERAAAGYLRQLCSALAYCHARNVLHRDIKPENLLLFHGAGAGVAAGSGEQLKLADFGWTVAQRRDAQRTTLCGTPEYLPPEVCETARGRENRAYGPAFDLYTVGILLYEMLVGTSPFACADPAQMSLEAMQLRILEGNVRMPVFVTSSAQSLIRALLARDPEARPTAADVLAHPWVVRLAGATRREEWE